MGTGSARFVGGQLKVLVVCTLLASAYGTACGALLATACMGVPERDWLYASSRGGEAGAVWGAKLGAIARFVAGVTDEMAARGGASEAWRRATRSMVAKLKVQAGCTLFGAAYGAVYGAILYFFILVRYGVQGDDWGEVLACALKFGGVCGGALGAIGGSVAGIVGSTTGGSLGWSVAGVVGAVAAGLSGHLRGLALLFIESETPVTVNLPWYCASLSLVVLLGISLAAALGHGLRKGRSSVPGVQRLAAIINETSPPARARKLPAVPAEVTPASAPEGRGDEATPARS